jgi:SAM-dependent methyltransferase
MLAPDLPGYEVERLWRPAGAGAFRFAPDGIWLRAGDELVAYRWRRGNAQDIAAINAMFSATYYTGHTGLWPDERAVIEAVVPERGARVLEICCGAGRLTLPLVRGGNRVVGLDVVAACLAAAPRAAGVGWVRADARALPFADGCFDLALCLENSLGVFPGEEARVIAELARVCRPGGRVILGLRHAAGPEETLERFCSAEGYLELARAFPERETARLLAGAVRAGGLRLLPQMPVVGPRPWSGIVGYWVLVRG